MKKTLSLLTLLLTICSGAWAISATITLSGSTTKASDRKVENALIPSIASSSATITTDACGSSCATTGYYLNTNDGKTCILDGTSYYLAHATQNNTKVAWSGAGLTNQYGTFTIPSGYTFKITKVSHALACQSASFTAAIIVKDAASNAKYTSSNISVPSVSDKGNASSTDILLETDDYVTLNAGTYTLNVNISSTNTGTGKYAGIAKVVLTGDLETAGIDTNSPEITTDLDDENAYTANLGVESTLSIVAEHVTGYQWYACTNAAGDGATAIDGATSYVYTFTPNAIGTYYYKCVATNTNATGIQTATSKVATVNVEATTPVFSLTNASILLGGTSQIIVGSKSGLDGLTMSDLTYDDNIISISTEGVITALAKGTTTITFTTAAAGNYAAGSANLSITVTGKVVASSTPNSWDATTTRTWSVSRIVFSGADEGGDNGLYFKTGNNNTISYTSSDYFSLKTGNTMYLEVPSATSTGTVKIISTQTNDRYLTITTSEGEQHLTMSKDGNTVPFDANSIEEIDGAYYIKIAHGDGECKITPTNFATVTLNAVVITSAGWASFSSDKALDFSNSGVTAYIAKEKNASYVTLTEISKVPANTGIVVNATAGTYEIPVLSGDADDTTGNLLKPWLTAGTPSETTYYTLAVNGTDPIFKKSSGGTLAAGKAYLVLSTSGGAASLGVDFGSEATGIEAIENVQMTDGNVYNLAGQRVAQPTKGLYIVNGKKVIIK